MMMPTRAFIDVLRTHFMATMAAALAAGQRVLVQLQFF